MLLGDGVLGLVLDVPLVPVLPSSLFSEYQRYAQYTKPIASHIKKYVQKWLSGTASILLVCGEMA